MEHSVSILFYTRLVRRTKGDLVPIYMRITLNGKRLEQSINRTVDLSKWSSKAGKMKGTHAEARALNSYLDAVRNKVHAIERDMLQDGKVIIYEAFKDKWFGVHEKPRMLIKIFSQHNNEIKELVGKISHLLLISGIKLQKIIQSHFLYGNIKWTI